MAPDPSDSFTDIKLSCACGQLTASSAVPTSSLPLHLVLCHCDTCRHVSGLMCITEANLPKDAKPLEVEGKVQTYNTSSALTRCFCGTCGTSVYEKGGESPDTIGICTGALKGGEGIVKLEHQLFVADTKDGGLAPWLLDGTPWEGWNFKSKEITKDSLFTRSKPNAKPQRSSDKLHCRCHCGGVEFDITAPSKESSNISSQLPDLLEEPPEQNESEQWWLRCGGTKYLAGNCACNSCRLGSGYDIQSWAFVPKANIHQKDGSPIDFAMGTLKQYNSSKDVLREFCGVCGAVVFYRANDRPDLIDVSTGLMEAESGARAEEWLEWARDKVSYAEYAQNKPLIGSLDAGLKAWGRIGV